MQRKMLIADDNRQIAEVLASYAKKEGFSVKIADDGTAALEDFLMESPCIVLLDVMMPEKDGFQVCREIRRQSDVPVIMITARGEDFERIMGLDTGADDYIVKPFSPGEVMARVRAVLRRVYSDTNKQNQLSCSNLFVDLDKSQVWIEGNEIQLTRRELDILWLLLSHMGKVYTREQLLDILWGYDYFGDSRTVDSHIKRLRAKLEQQPHPDWQIKTIWGRGYKFEAL